MSYKTQEIKKEYKHKLKQTNSKQICLQCFNCAIKS